MVIFSWKDLGVVTLRFGAHLPSRWVRRAWAAGPGRGNRQGQGWRTGISGDGTGTGGGECGWELGSGVGSESVEDAESLVE